MARLIKANEEEEKRNGEINVAQLLPSPYVQHPPAFSTMDGLSGYPPSSAGPYPEYAMSSPSDRRISSPNGFSAHQDMDLSALAAGRAATTQYTPTHSRAGSQLTHDPARPHSMVLSAHDPTTLSRPNSAVPPEASSSNLAPESAASAKAREAYQHRRALIAQNAAEGDDGDIIIPENAQAVRGNVPPSAWAMPPPAYSPDS
ncbi:hypothetical protein CPB86DRAFT_774166 [Serendipita vermifera]|nr:hypothetical protein CPB86DRAFT_774166 [Serendipita vermifera]